MKLLLDTHIWVWYLLGDSRLSTTLPQAIADEKNELWLSSISLWETHLLAEKGRLILEPSPEQWIADSSQKLDTKEATLSNRPVRNIISSLKCLHYKQYKEYNLFLMSHSFSSELN